MTSLTYLVPFSADVDNSSADVVEAVEGLADQAEHLELLNVRMPTDKQ